jgi:glycosyltransferase involved in cell wall biosynthesis
MNGAGQTICLCMIVKNEAHVIRRCLESVRPIIDYWVIVDTGSSDGTQDVIRAAMADVPGFVVDRPWVDFAYNRSEALALARPHGDYSLIIDADDDLVIPEGFVMPKLEASGYFFTILDGFIEYTRIQLVNNTLDWRYRGVLHEFVDCSDMSALDALPLAMRRGEDGARHKDLATFWKDAAVLEKALATEQDPMLVARYTFYLAQSYRDAGEHRKALEYYLKRSELGFWDEEVYVSLLSVAYLMEGFNKPEDEICAIYDRAIAICPHRAEARHGASRMCRSRRDFVRGLRYAEAGMPPRMPDTALFLQKWIYNYGLMDEYAVNAYCTGQYRACLFTCLAILTHKDVPPEHRLRIARLSREALSKMVDAIWGLNRFSYSTPLLPYWQR